MAVRARHGRLGSLAMAMASALGMSMTKASGHAHGSGCGQVSLTCLPPGQAVMAVAMAGFFGVGFGAVACHAHGFWQSHGHDQGALVLSMDLVVMGS